MKSKIDDPFWTNPKFTATLNHCGIEISLSLKIEEQDYLTIAPQNQGSGQFLNDAYCLAIDEKAHEIVKTVLQFHGEFLQALEVAESDVKRSQDG